MIVISGRITGRGTGRPVPGLTVSTLQVGPALDGESATAFLLGSGTTDMAGRYTITADPEGDVAPRIRIRLEVTPPAGSEAPREPLHRSEASVAIAGHVAFDVRLAESDLAAAGVLPPLGQGEDLAARASQAASGGQAVERALGKALTNRRKADETEEDAHRQDFLPRFLADAIRSDGPALGAYPYVVGASDEQAPGALARTAIGTGVERIKAERNPVAAAPQPGEPRPARRRTRYFFSQDQLDRLNTETVDDDPATPPFRDIAETALFSILGLGDRVAREGRPTVLSREEDLFADFLTETREESCAAEVLAGPAAPPAPTGTEAPTAVVAADRDSILTRVARAIEDVRAPLAALTGNGGSAPGIAASIQSFAIPVGPADKPRVFDFAALEVAFDDVWQTVIDRRLEPLSRALYVKTSRVLKGSAFPASELATYSGIRKALVATRAAISNAAPSVLAKRNDGRGPRPGFEDGLDVVLPDPVDPPPPPPVGPERPEYVGGEYAFENVTSLDEGDAMDPDANPEDLAAQIDEILRQPHAFTAFGADGRSKAINFGIAVGYRHIMTPVTYQVGDLVKTVTLAPNESREYTTRAVTTRKRAEKEVIKNSSIRRDELSETNRAESEIVRKALAKTNFSLNTDGTYNLGLSKGTAKSASGRDGETNSNDVKKNFREAVRKASEELRQERTIDVSFQSEDTFEQSSKGRIENTNGELTLTYLFFELQRRFRVNETIQKVTPVVLVAQDVPAPDEITNAFIVRHAWVIKRALLDDGFMPALAYVQGPIVGDRLNVITLKETLDSHRRQVGELRTQLVALEEQAGRRYEALVQAVNDRLAEEAAEETDGFFSDLADSLFGDGQETGTARLREEAARDAELRAAEKAKEMAVQLQRGINALNEATEAYNRANNRYHVMAVDVSRLRLHIKEHILHYMQAIWAHEVEDQRFLRLYRQPVPQFVRQDGTQPVYRRLADSAGVTRVSIADDHGVVAAEQRFAVDFELLPSVDVLDERFDRPLVEVADLTRLLGFFGNYMIFPMTQSNALTDMMLDPYVDEGLRLLDPDDPGNVTRPEFADYICRLRARLTDAEFESIREALSTRYRELLLSSEYSGDEIVVPSGALYMEALPGATPLLEPFKLAHRAFDLVQAQEAARQKALENLRFAARIVENDLGDPDTDARYDFYGAPGVVAPDPGAGGDGS